MTLYFLDRNTLEIKDVLSASKFSLNFDEETNAVSNITLHKKPIANENDFIVAKKGETIKYQGIISQLQGEKNSNQVVAICKDISNLFNRKIYVDGLSYMDTSLEDFLFYTINKFFKFGDDDSNNAMPYLTIVEKTQTSIKEALNDEDGIYNFHTFMTNCRQHKNISVSFEITQSEIIVTIENTGNQDIIKIDTTNNDVINYNKVYEINIISRVTVKCGDTGNVLNYYLLTDRTISTEKHNINRADGDLTTIYVDEESKAYEQATNIFKSNRYNHLVEFEIKQDSKLVNTDDLTIGRPIQIKTKDGILESYISSIGMEEKSKYIKYKSGNIRVDLIDKLKQTPYKVGINKVDKAVVDKISSYLTTEQVIGKWLNGENLYRKVLYITNLQQAFHIDPNLTNAKEIINVYGMSKRTNSYFNSLPCTYPNWEIFLYDYASDNITVRFSNNQWNAGVDYIYIICEYTKTTY